MLTKQTSSKLDTYLKVARYRTGFDIVSFDIGLYYTLVAITSHSLIVPPGTQGLNNSEPFISMFGCMSSIVP